MEAKLLKKNEWYTIDNGLGPIRAQLLESPKQGRGWKSIVFMDVKGSDAGFFDEAGSVYTKDILVWPRRMLVGCWLEMLVPSHTHLWVYIHELTCKHNEI